MRKQLLSSLGAVAVLGIATVSFAGASAGGARTFDRFAIDKRPDIARGHLLRAQQAMPEAGLRRAAVAAETSDALVTVMDGTGDELCIAISDAGGRPESLACTKTSQQDTPTAMPFGVAQRSALVLVPDQAVGIEASVSAGSAQVSRNGNVVTAVPTDRGARVTSISFSDGTGVRVVDVEALRPGARRLGDVPGL